MPWKLTKKGYVQSDEGDLSIQSSGPGMWDRLKELQKMREEIKASREKQNKINEDYKRKHQK